MANLAKFLTVLVSAAFLGLAATFVAVEGDTGLGMLAAGPWRSYVKAGSPDIDPYALARFARSGEIPLALAEGLSFVATTDSDGSTLTGRCDYVFHGPMPAARYWTLTALSPQGGLIDNAAARYGFVSSEILRAENGDFAIVVAGHARPGNWLPMSPRPFALMLRLYDTTLSNGSAALDLTTMPQIVKSRCS